AGRRARENPIPRMERENLRKIADYRADREYRLSRVAVLHYFAVKAQADREFVRIRNLVRRHERGPGWGKRVESLAGHPLLAVFLELPIACRDVVADGVAGHVIHGLLRAYIAAALADHDNQLGFVIDLLAYRRKKYRVRVADEGGRILAEEHRVLRNRHPSLLGVVRIVKT